jgi:hypothetical protein
VDALQEVCASAGSAASTLAIPGATPVDLLWEVYGEQGTKWFHRLGKHRAGMAPGISRVTAVGDAGSEVSCSVHDRGGLVQVGRLLSGFFDGSAGGLFAPGQVDGAAHSGSLVVSFGQDCTLRGGGCLPGP